MVSRLLLVLPVITASIAQEARSSDFTVASRLANETVRQKVERGNQSVVAGRGADQRVCRNRSTHHLAEFVSPTLDVPDSARTLPQADEAQAGIKKIPLRVPDSLIGRTGIRLPDVMSAQEPANDSAQDERAGMPLAGWVLVFLVLLYPLSVGPVVILSGGQLTPTLEAFYSPLEFLYDHVPVVHDFYEWYFGVWGIK